MKKIVIKEGDFAICLKNYLILRRPCLSAGLSKKIQQAKLSSGMKEMEILVNIRRKTELLYMEQCFNSKKLARFFAEKMKMNLLLITKEKRKNDYFAVYRFINKSRWLVPSRLFYPSPFKDHTCLFLYYFLILEG